MKIRDVMTRDVDVLSPEASLREAAVHMRDRDIGSIPIADNDRLIGMVTDRDIVIRCVADGQDCEQPVREAMTDRVLYCFEDQDVDEVCHNMADEVVRRLPVVSRDKRLVGIVSLGDIARQDDDAAGEALEQIAAAPSSNRSRVEQYPHAGV